jgi:hypothetical protein
MHTVSMARLLLLGTALSLMSPALRAQTYVQPHVMAWSPPNPASSETPDEYCLYRSVNGGAYNQLVCLPATILSYTDTSLTFGSRYCYKAKSKKASTESTAFSEVFCVSALPTQGR